MVTNTNGNHGNHRSKTN